PLLAGDPMTLEARLVALLGARRAALREAHVHVDGARDPAIVAADVAALARDAFAWVPAAAGGYPVRLARDGATATAQAARALDPAPLHLVADAAVVPTWAGAIRAALAAAGRPSPGSIEVPSGEEHKRLSTLEALAEALLA